MANERPDPVRADGYPPSDAVMARWRADWRTIPRDQWDIAVRSGWLGPVTGWAKPLKPHPAPSKDDVAHQNVIEYEFTKNGFDLDGKSWVLDRPGSSSTFIAFRLGRDGTLLPGHPMPWDQRGALCIVRLGKRKRKDGREEFTCSIQVWNIWNDRLAEHGWSVIPFDEESATDLDDEAYFRAKYHWYVTDAVAENGYQAVRRAMNDIFGAGEDGMPIVGPFDVGWQPDLAAPAEITEDHAASGDGTASTAADGQAPTEEPIDAFSHAIELAAEIDATLARNEPPEEDWDDWEVDEVIADDDAPLAESPDRAFDLPIADVTGGSVFLVGHSLVLITGKGHIRRIPTPVEFRGPDDTHVDFDVDGIADWLALADGTPPDDLPTQVSEIGEYLGMVTEDAFRTPIAEAANEPRRRRRRRAKFLIGSAAAVAALGAGATSCWEWGDGPDQDAALMEMQDEAVLREMAAEEAALTCLMGSPAFDAATGECTGGGEAFDDVAGWCSGWGANVGTDLDECDFSGVADPADAAAPCVDNGGDWNPDLSVCGFGGDGAGTGSDADATGTCSANQVFDEVSGTCTAIGDSDPARECEGDGGDWDVDLGVCRYTAEPYHAALGVTPPGAAIADPSGGQSGSDTSTWRRSPDVDISEYSAWLASITGNVFDQLFGNTSYPCGAETADYRVVCPLGAAEAEPGDFVVVTTTLADAIDPAGQWLTYGLAFDDPDADNYRGRPPFELDLFNDTEVWYRYEIDPDGERHVYADGFRGGAPNFPRYSAVRLVEFIESDTLVWVVPRAELPDGELRYRATAFRSAAGPLAPPDPSTDGGDVSGLDVSTLDTISDTLVGAELGPDIPPDAEPGQELTDGPGADPDVFMAAVLIEDLAARWNTAFGAGDVDSVVEVIHPVSVFGSADGCQSFVDRIFPGAQQIALTPSGSGPAVSDVFVTYSAVAQVTYPTGMTEFQTQLAVGPGGRLAPIFQCDA